MNKKYLIAMIVLAAACNKQPAPKVQNPDDSNFQQRRQEQKQRQQGGCCEVEKTQASPLAEQVAPVQKQDTVATPEVKVEAVVP